MAEPRPPQEQPTIRVTAMPADANFYGDIFGGWLTGLMDLAAGSVASRRSRGRAVTVSIQTVVFHHPVQVGDEGSGLRQSEVCRPQLHEDRRGSLAARPRQRTHLQSDGSALSPLSPSTNSAARGRYRRKTRHDRDAWISAWARPPTCCAKRCAASPPTASRLWAAEIDAENKFPRQLAGNGRARPAWHHRRGRIWRGWGSAIWSMSSRWKRSAEPPPRWGCPMAPIPISASTRSAAGGSESRNAAICRS